MPAPDADRRTGAVDVVSLEETEDAVLEGDRPYAPGTARAALAHRDFRTLYTGFFLSSIGTWMQSATLTYFAYSIFKSAVFNSALLFAQLGPVLLLGPLAGVIADSFDRKRLLAVTSVAQLCAAGGLALVVIDPNPNRALMVVFVGIGGIFSATFTPVYSALLPSLVGQRDLPGAISLQSAGMNLSRVIGPPIGIALLNVLGADWVFAVNGATFLFVIAALRGLHLPAQEQATEETERGFRRLGSGFRIARRDPIVSKSLVTVTVFSVLCLLWIGQLPVFALDQLGIGRKDTRYGVLYACLGLGAALGSIASGTVLAKRSKPKIVRFGFVAYAVILTVFALLRDPVAAYVVMVLLGAAYFGSITALNTTMQTRLVHHERGRVMALWMMGFGGAVSVGNLALAPLVDLVGMPPLMIAGAAITLGLAWYADLRTPDERPAPARGPGGDPVPAPAD
jgi:predicted MFS family arabinose efflux permease